MAPDARRVREVFWAVVHHHDAAGHAASLRRGYPADAGLRKPAEELLIARNRDFLSRPLVLANPGDAA